MQTQKIYEDFSNKEIAKEIIINTLNEILELSHPKVRTELEDVANELFLNGLMNPASPATSSSSKVSVSR